MQQPTGNPALLNVVELKFRQPAKHGKDLQVLLLDVIDPENCILKRTFSLIPSHTPVEEVLLYF